MKLNICMITYNHEKYIKTAIESVLSQITNFDFRLIIGEDHSTDLTRSICMEYAANYPEKIKLITSDTNLGMMKNFTRTFKACDGQYVAFIEGDDYWTDTGKLQKQVDLLEANPQYSACFHNVLVKMERQNENREWILHKKLEKDVFETGDILRPWFIASPSFMFVNYPDLILPSWYYNCKYGDLPLMLLLSLRGQFKYIDEVMAVYRLHDTGMSIQHQGYDKIILMTYIYESFNIHTSYAFQEKAREAVIYEINKHTPKQVGQTVTFKKEPILYKVYRKIKKSMS